MAETEEDADLVRRSVNYDPITGLFTWAVNVGRGQAVRAAGAPAGWINGDGAIRIQIKGRRFLAHRVAWLLMTGDWPKALVDHRNLQRDDNRWSNLREASHTQNRANSPVRRTNKTGLKGAAFMTREQKWQATLTKHGVRYDLGLFDCPVAAHLAYVVAADKHFGEFARGI